MSAIFQPQISSLESQIVEIQAKIAAFTEAEFVTDGAIQALQGAVEKVSSLAPEAITTLRTAVLDLFRGGSNDDGNGNQPIPPAPQPGFDDRTPRVLALDACREYAIEQEAIAPLPELTGQSSEWASPLTSPLASPLSSWLCCQLEDVPSEGGSVESATPTDTPPALTGQSVEIACVVSDAPPIPEYIELVPLNHLVAYQRKTSTGEIICCYVGGNNKNRLKDWGSWLCTQHSVGAGFEVRKAVRLTAYNHELKIWGMSLKQIQRLAQEDTTKTPPSRYHVASMPVAERLLAKEVESAPEEKDPEVSESLATVTKLEQVPSPEPQGFQVGDRVEVTSDRHGVELVGLTGIVTAATKSGAAVDVNNTLRYFCVDELAAISTPVSHADLDPTEDEKVAIASIQPPAYNLNPIGRGGAVANWKARQAAGIGVDLKNCGTGGIKTMAEWQQIEAEQKAEKALAATASTSDEEPDF